MGIPPYAIRLKREKEALEPKEERKEELMQKEMFNIKGEIKQKDGL
jgi:hypothetical protein